VVAREREWACLGTRRGVEGWMHVLVWSGGQRGSGELEVVCLGFCQSKGEGIGKGGTPGADRWGGVIY
jgi:hypothetical protein